MVLSMGLRSLLHGWILMMAGAVQMLFGSTRAVLVKSCAWEKLRRDEWIGEIYFMLLCNMILKQGR
jgi:hypothetical protein